MTTALGTIDWSIIVLYLVGITAVGIFSARRSTESSENYFLAARSLRWPTIGLALFATNISTVHLIGLASSGFSTGMVVGNFEWLAATCLVLLGLVFAPFYFRSRVATLPEFLERRFSGGSRTMLAIMGVFGALFVHIGVSLYAGGVVVDELLHPRTPGVDRASIVWSILIVSGLTVLYTVLGGLRAVVVTEAIQTVLLLLGAAAVTLACFAALNDSAATAGQGLVAYLQTRTRPDQLSAVHASGDYAWYAMLLGYPVLGIWYWCSDQTIVQRVLGAATARDAQIGPLFAGFLKILPPLLMVLPGVFAYVLFRDLIEANPDSTLVVLILELLPPGVRGLVLAGLLAALMSTVAGALNSTSTLVSIDIVKRLWPATADRRLVRIGQATTVAVMVLAVAWSTQGDRFGGIFAGINQMIAVLAPPISAVFLLGVLWRRGTAQASLATLVAGFALGIAVFLVDFPAASGAIFGAYTSATAPSESLVGQPVQLITHGLGIGFMLQAWWLFAICSVLFVLCSLATPAPDPNIVGRYCYSRKAGSRDEAGFSPSSPGFLSVVLLGAIGILYLVFS